MRLFFGTLLVATMSILSASAVFAQDFEPGEWWSPDPFSGAYIGMNAGWVRAWADQTVTSLGGPFPVTVRTSSEDDGFAAGLHAGYNWQFGSAVYGFETDFSYMDVDPSFTPPVGPTIRASYDFFGTVRGRLGWAFENVLFYGTGGFAYAGVDHEFLTGPVAGNFSDHDVVPGWTAGGGTEWAIDPYTFLRVEALYVDLEDTTRTYIRQDDPQFRNRIRWEDEFVVVRLGLSVKFP